MHFLTHYVTAAEEGCPFLKSPSNVAKEIKSLFSQLIKGAPVGSFSDIAVNLLWQKANFGM